VKIDEDLLRQIASMTGGQYFRATSNKALEEVYRQIDQLEKSKIQVTEYNKRNEEYRRFALIALVLLLGELVLRNTVLRSIP